MEVISKYKALMPAIQHASRILSDYNSKEQGHVVFDIDDTLIFDDDRTTPNVQVKHLLDVARACGYKIHLVTAREKSAEVTKWTRDELRRHGIRYESLALAPKKVRTSMKDVALWKHSERKSHSAQGPVVMSVGDQWGDGILIRDENHIDELNQKYNIDEWPWIILSPKDGVTLYSFKLMA